MFCKFCGEKIEENALFCSRCGTSLKSSKTDETIVVSTPKKEEKPLLNKVLSIVQKCSHIGILIGMLGVATFLGIVLVGLIFYGSVYLFDGYDFTEVLSIISIVLMMIGLCSIIVKCILVFVFKIGKLPSTNIKRVLCIVLAVACLGFSIWGFVDCDNNSYKDDSSYESGGGYSGNYDTLVSEYIGLSLSVTKIETSGNYTYVYGSVKNVSSLYGTATKYRYIKVKGVFYDRYNSIVDTDWTFAIDSTWLNAGETRTFYFMVRNTSIKSASLYITE